jgi:glycosyltransferase involved in cell wall biosynthesis
MRASQNMLENKVLISFFVPVYNKETTVLETVDLIDSGMRIFSYEYEIIICNDGSIDNSPGLMKDLANRNKRVVYIENTTNIGFYKSFLKCVHVGRGELGMYISADADFDKLLIEDALSQINNYQVVITYSFNQGSRAFFRRHISQLYTRYLNYVTFNKIKYYNGMNIYPLKFLKECRGLSNSFAFQAEILLIAIKRFSYTQVPSNYIHSDDFSSVLRLKNIYNVLYFSIMLAIKRFFGSSKN